MDDPLDEFGLEISDKSNSSLDEENGMEESVSSSNESLESNPIMMHNPRAIIESVTAQACSTIHEATSDLQDIAVDLTIKSEMNKSSDIEGIPTFSPEVKHN